MRKLNPESIGGFINDAMQLGLIGLCMYAIGMAVWVGMGAFQ